MILNSKLSHDGRKGEVCRIGAVYFSCNHVSYVSILYVHLKKFTKKIVDFFFCTFFFRYETEDILRFLYSIPVLQR